MKNSARTICRFMDNGYHTISCSLYV